MPLQQPRLERPGIAPALRRQDRIRSQNGSRRAASTAPAGSVDRGGARDAGGSDLEGAQGGADGLQGVTQAAGARPGDVPL